MLKSLMIISLLLHFCCDILHVKGFMNRFAYISKSSFLFNLQCPKLLWLKMFDKAKLSNPNASNRFVFAQGNDVGTLACSLFEGGVEIENSFDYPQMAAQTKALMESGTRTIYEATFIYEQMLVMVDILHQNSSGSWEIYEVKSATSLKELYIHDAAYQLHVLTKNGLHVSSVNVVYLNKSYLLEETLDLSKLFHIECVSEQAKALQGDIEQHYNTLLTMLEEPMPKVEIGEHCFEPYACAARSFCWKHVEDPSGFDLVDLIKSQRFPKDLNGIERTALYKEQGLLSTLHVENLNYRQKKQFNAYQTNARFCDMSKLKKLFGGAALESFQVVKIHFTAYAIPQLQGQKPYSSVPFAITVMRSSSQTIHCLFSTLPDNASFNKQLFSMLDGNTPTVLFHNGFQTGALKKLGVDAAKFINIEKAFSNLYYYDASFLNDFTLQSVIGHFSAEQKNALSTLHVKSDDEVQLAWRYETIPAFETALKAYGEWWCRSVALVAAHLLKECCD